MDDLFLGCRVGGVNLPPSCEGPEEALQSSLSLVPRSTDEGHAQSDVLGHSRAQPGPQLQLVRAGTLGRRPPRRDASLRAPSAPHSVRQSVTSTLSQDEFDALGNSPDGIAGGSTTGDAMRLARTLGLEATPAPDPCAAERTTLAMESCVTEHVRRVEADIRAASHALRPC